MGLVPDNPVVGGTVLRREAIQSPGYVAGSAGWNVGQDGSAEFNDVTVRGTFAGLDYEIRDDGAFFYSGTPGPGNLILAITHAGGTDPTSGQAYSAGISTYNEGGLSGGMNLFTEAASEGTNAFVATYVINKGAANEYLALEISGAKDKTYQQNVYIVFWSSAADHSVDASGAFYYVDANGNEYNCLQWGGAGITAVCEALYAQQPGASVPTAENWHTISTGFPSGWTGAVNYKKLPSGEIMLDWHFTIASGTVVSSGVTVATLPAGYAPLITKILPSNYAYGGNNYAQGQIDPSSQLSYHGPGGTLTAAAYWYGQGIYTPSV